MSLELMLLWRNEIWRVGESIILLQGLIGVQAQSEDEFFDYAYG